MAEVVVIGAGMGGLAAALRLRRLGHAVRVLEARDEPGGLASGFERDGFRFDGGPYILLDRAGLEWAFARLGLVLAEHVTLKPLAHVYEVTRPDGPTLRFRASAEETAEAFERLWPGCAARYRRFVAAMSAHHARLRPLLYRSPRGARDLLRGGGWKSAPLLLRSLERVLARSGLPAPLRDGLAIWTHVAGRSVGAAPSVMAFVPAIVHENGAAYPLGGVAAVPRALAAAAQTAGVAIDYRTPVRRIVCAEGAVRGVETADGRFIEAARVVSNAGGPKTYLELAAAATPEAEARRLRALPLQSPGVAAYLLARGALDEAYLRFFLPAGGAPCRLLIRPAAVEPGLARDGWWPARLLAPLGHAEAEKGGRAGQEAALEALLAERWWREGVSDSQVVARRLPVDWGAAFSLHRDAMNPVMTARLMRTGRMAHRSPWLRGLYLAGSATHPGQWVSFCAVSGVLAAERLHEDAR